MIKNAVLLAHKPAGVSSNKFLSTLKREFGVKKAGYSGTLDPFASGALMIGIGSYTKLLPHIQTSPKKYRATLWLGAKSRTLDIESIESVQEIQEVGDDALSEILESLRGEICYRPPIFSAKHIDGKRAYKLARDGVELEMPECKMNIFDIRLICYRHPFVSFEVCVSKGGYVRSVGEIIASRLRVDGCLSALERVSEGRFDIGLLGGEKYKILSAFDVLSYEICDEFLKYRGEIMDGKKINVGSIGVGRYIANFDDFFSIIDIREDGSVEYILNRIEKC